MTLVVPNTSETVALELYLRRALTLKLFANDLTPVETTLAQQLIEVSGGGYAAKSLAAELWDIINNQFAETTYGIYATQEFLFTGPTGGTGKIYGYYIVDEENIICFIERFSESILPYIPKEDAIIRITPKLEAS